MEGFGTGVASILALLTIVIILFGCGIQAGEEQLAKEVRKCVVANSGEINHAYNVCFSTYAPKATPETKEGE